MISLEYEKCRMWIEQMLSATGVPEEVANRTTEIFLRASIRHTGHHDITYLPQRLDLLQREIINPKGEMKEVFRTPSLVRYDGEGALGEYCCSYMLSQTIDLARAQGIAMGTVAHSNHFLAGHPYGQIAAEKGCMAILWSNTDPCMGDPKSQGEVIGNNPMGFGAPGNDHPWILDLCMAYSSLGKLGDLAQQGKTIPEYWGKNPNGDRTQDPKEVLDGGICSPMGEHKGFGLSLMHELMTSGLSQGEMGPEVVPRGGWQKHSQTVLVIDLQTCGVQNNWQSRMNKLRLDFNDKLADPIRLPGDHLYKEKERSSGDIQIPQSCYDQLKSFSQIHDITLPQ